MTHRVSYCTCLQVLSAILVYSLSSAVGQNFVYYTLTQFDPLVLTTVTTTRKIFSTLYSVFRNPSNRLNGMQWGGTSLVFAGLVGDVLAKALKPKAAPPPPPPPQPEPTGEEAPEGEEGKPAA